MIPKVPDPEWSENKKWNPFNSDKLLAQVYRWRLIQKGKPIPQPALVTVDPINACNLACTWCNSSPVLGGAPSCLSPALLKALPDFLADWQGSPDWEKGVEAVCIAGGGEPLLHPDTGGFIRGCVDKGIQVGVVTNGTRIHEFLPDLALCTWVGVSVDAGTPETFAVLKGKDRFAKVTENIAALVAYSQANQSFLAGPGQGRGVSYKFLLHPGNFGEIETAARLARDLGCRNFHLRPAGIPWYRLAQASSFFPDDQDILIRLRAGMDRARTLETKGFGVFGIMHKFDPGLGAANRFHQCHAIFMTAVFMPGREPGTFDLGLCCDRRGDEGLVLGQDLETPGQVAERWGSPAHWGIFDRIRVASCPRCTYQPHNRLFEHVILEDNMTYRFI